MIPTSPEPITAEDIGQWQRELEAASAADMLAKLERRASQIAGIRRRNSWSASWRIATGFST